MSTLELLVYCGHGLIVALTVAIAIVLIKAALFSRPGGRDE